MFSLQTLLFVTLLCPSEKSPSPINQLAWAGPNLSLIEFLHGIFAGHPNSNVNADGILLFLVPRGRIHVTKDFSRSYLRLSNTRHVPSHLNVILTVITSLAPSKMTHKGHVALIMPLLAPDDPSVGLEFCVMTTGVGIAYVGNKNTKKVFLRSLSDASTDSTLRFELL